MSFVHEFNGFGSDFIVVVDGVCYSGNTTGIGTLYINSVANREVLIATEAANLDLWSETIRDRISDMLHDYKEA